MTPTTGHDDTGLRATGDLLRAYVYAADEAKTDEIEESFTEIRDRYAAIPEGTPDDTVAAIGMAFLTSAKLHAYVRNDLGEKWWTPEEVSPALPEDDTVGRALADDAVRAARRALEVDPSDNLAAFSLGLALVLLGHDESAVSALLTAYRLDPADDVTAAWLEELDAPLPEHPGPPAACRHTHGFFLLRHETMVANNGDTAEWTWLFGDATQIRAAVDAWVDDMPWGDVIEQGDLEYWDPAAPDFDPVPNDDITVEIHVPGEEPLIRRVDLGLRWSTDGYVHMDWAAVPLPDMLPHPLPAGRPVRVGGSSYLFGANEPGPE